MRLTFMALCVFALSATVQAQAQERQWSLDTVNNQVFLVFGVPESDDVGLSFWCDIGKTKVQAFLPEGVAAIRRGQQIKINVKIDAYSEKILALVAGDDGSQKLTVETTFGLQGSLMKALRAGQSLGINVNGHESHFPLADADFDGFVGACKGIEPLG